MARLEYYKWLKRKKVETIKKSKMDKWFLNSSRGQGICRRNQYQGLELSEIFLKNIHPIVLEEHEIMSVSGVPRYQPGARDALNYTLPSRNA